MKTTGYNDLNGKEILLGDKVIINANPHYGEYEVKFGEYRLDPFKKHQIEVPHLGFYLTNGENIVSFMYVIKQPTGYASGIHTIEVIGSSIVEKSKAPIINDIFSLDNVLTSAQLEAFYDFNTLIANGDVYIRAKIDDENILTPIYRLKQLLSTRAFYSLLKINITYIQQLEKFYFQDLMRIPNVGYKTAIEIESVLKEEFGISIHRK